MPWPTTVTAANVRAECALITVAIRSDAQVLAEVVNSEATINNLLRGKYDLTDPGADPQVKQASLFLTCASLLHSIYGEQPWADKEGTARGDYYRQRWLAFYADFINGKIQLSLTPVTTIGPSVYNEPLGTAEYSQFDLNSKQDNALSLVVTE